MMARRMAGLFALMALGAYLWAWLWSGGAEAPGSGTLEEAWLRGVMVVIGYWLTGLFVATLGIGLVREVLAERGGREAERRFRAKARYDALLFGDAPGGSNARE